MPMRQDHHSHAPDAIRMRLESGPKRNYLREWVYGGIDGVVTTFAIVAGVVGANLSPPIIIILGMANLIGDGFSMAASAYSGARTDEDTYEYLRAAENDHIDRNPEGETEELRQIYLKKGFSGEKLQTMVGLIKENREMWVDVMMREEYGLAADTKPAIKIGLHTFGSFVCCGIAPLLPFFFSMPYAFVAALILSAVTFFGIGSFKSLWSVKPWWRHGMETTAIGMTAAMLAYMIGHALKGLGL